MNGTTSQPVTLDVMTPGVCASVCSCRRYADRAKAIPVHATKNDESEQIEKLNNEIAVLRKMLEEQVRGSLFVTCVALTFTAATVVVRLRRVRESGWSTLAPWRRSASSAMHMLHTVIGVLSS